jgi:hypothetical protein
MRPGSHRRSHRVLAGAAIACAALAVGGCGSDDPDGPNPGGGDVSFAEAKRGVAALVDDTYEAVLSGLDVRRHPEHAIPCREAGGAGGATGDYAANGALRIEVPKGAEGKDLVRRVRDHWQEKGYESIRVVPSGEAVFAQTDGYRLSFEVVPDVGRGVLGAGGPCATPESKAELNAPPEFKALAG